jgi:hypothetical protein
MWGEGNPVIHSLSGPIFVDNGFFRFISVDDGIFLRPHVVGLRHAWIL